MYEMEGDPPGLAAPVASCLASPAPRAVRRGRAPAKSSGFPDSPAFPAYPGGAPFPA
jgi:hypothetical protein